MQVSATALVVGEGRRVWMGCGNKGRNEGRNEPQHGAHTQNRLECGRKGQQRNVCGRGRIRGDKGLGSLGGGGAGGC